MIALHKLALFFALSMLVIPANAEQILQCAFPPKAANGGWMPDQVVLSYDATKQTVTVFDPIIRYFAKVPIAAAVNADNTSRLSVSWTVKATESNSNQYADMKYRLTYLKSGGNASMTGQALNFAGPYTAQGRCVVGTRKKR